ncbi:GNAT family N-acetyltransferase [Actinomyces sp. 432]|nr:GNAT family N-acetyltransferase [Actinomyces sp. 594]NDR54457.1 GNAT family N-acetyltransferase [Actinomyces sp. 565]QHO92366.1 GNAT family N-acetyltransferase [Actinomyces sp. 432]
MNGSVDDAELERLHAEAFGLEAEVPPPPWAARLREHSLFWVTTRVETTLVGFVNVLGDGGLHAILMDTCVSPRHQGLGIGTRMVEVAAQEARRRGCRWLHVDYDPPLASFYETGCGMSATSAALLDLGSADKAAPV